ITTNPPATHGGSPAAADVAEGGLRRLTRATRVNGPLKSRTSVGALSLPRSVRKQWSPPGRVIVSSSRVCLNLQSLSGSRGLSHPAFQNGASPGTGAALTATPSASITRAARGLLIPAPPG